MTLITKHIDYTNNANNTKNAENADNANSTDAAGRETGSVNLMAEIAKSIAGGVFIPSVLAAELNISSKELSDRLFMR